MRIKPTFSAPEIELVVEDGEQDEEVIIEDGKVVLDTCKSEIVY